jgi:hypothetical protein
MEIEMLDFSKILFDGGILSALFLVLVAIIGLTKPRLFLNKEDVPADILAAVPPKTDVEKKQAVLAVIPLMLILTAGTLYSTYTFYLTSGANFMSLFAHALIILVMISASDLVIMDWLILNTWTPKRLTFPGTKGFAGYKDYGFHGRAHLKALPLLLFGAGISAGLTLLISAVL